MQRRAIAAYLVLLAIFAGLAALPQPVTPLDQAQTQPFTAQSWAPLPRPYAQVSAPVSIKREP